MPETEGRKNKLFKGLTDHDILVWEEEKMRHQRKVGKKITDIEFLRYLLMAASRPVISAKEGVSSGLIVGNGPIYEKADAFLDRIQSKTVSQSAVVEEKPPILAEKLQPESLKKEDLTPPTPQSPNHEP
jgi:hypothetical protein